MALLIEASHKNENPMVYSESLNAPEPTDAPLKDWLYPAVGGHYNFSASRRI
jgi:hypothetical protein